MDRAKMRPVSLWEADVVWETRPDGSKLVYQSGPLNEYPDSLFDRFEYWAEKTPNALWMAERNQENTAWIKMTYRDMLSSIRAIGQALLNLGLTTERPLIILSGNSIAHALVALGAQYVGVPSAAIAPAYSLMSGGFEKLIAVRNQITPGAVFVEDTKPFSAAIDTVFADAPVFSRTGQGSVLDWEDLLSTPLTESVWQARASLGPDTVAKFIFTSGTTGAPKAVIQTQRMLCANMEMAADCFRYFQEDPPVFLDWAPWNHVASGNKVFNMSMYHGGSFYIDNGKPAPGAIDRTIRNLREVSPTWYFNVPAGYEMLIEAMKADKALAQSFFKDLKLLMYAGAGMAAHTWQGLEALALQTTGEYVFLTSGLGATETAPFALYNSLQQEVPGNVGIPAKGLILKLVPNEGKWEARLKGPSVTPGYWRDPDLTAGAFDDEGFYLLGDALRFADENDPGKGFFFDGRVAENFKLNTGTWVSVGAVRAQLTDALGGLARDVVLTGEGRASLGAMLVPFEPALARLVNGAEDLTLPQLCGHPAVRAEVSRLLARYNSTATGSSMRVPQVMFLTSPLDLDKGEVTDKGSVNQRAVLRYRSDIVEALYAESSEVIR
ncbi:MAG: feruloyl-CoA synthase [Maritimibacter sp.]